MHIDFMFAFIAKGLNIGACECVSNENGTFTSRHTKEVKFKEPHVKCIHNSLDWINHGIYN